MVKRAFQNLLSIKKLSREYDRSVNASCSFFRKLFDEKFFCTSFHSNERQLDKNFSDQKVECKLRRNERRVSYYTHNSSETQIAALDSSRCIKTQRIFSFSVTTEMSGSCLRLFVIRGGGGADKQGITIWLLFLHISWHLIGQWFSSRFWDPHRVQHQISKTCQRH